MYPHKKIKHLITHQSILTACSQEERTIAEDRFQIHSQQHRKDNCYRLEAEKIDLIEQSVTLIKCIITYIAI